MTTSLYELCYPHWVTAPEGCVFPIGDTVWLYRMPGSDPPKKCLDKYTDDNIVFSVFYGKNERYLGFGVQALRPGFVSASQAQWLTLADASSTKHNQGTMKVLIDFAPLRMISIANDGNIGVSYQVSTRRKDTCL